MTPTLDKFPAHDACRLIPGTTTCLNAALPLCEYCPWWVALAADPAELLTELGRCVWPDKWGKDPTIALVNERREELAAMGYEVEAGDYEPDHIDPRGPGDYGYADYDPAEDADSELRAGYVDPDDLRGSVTPDHGESPQAEADRLGDELADAHREMRVIVFDEDGAHDLGDKNVESIDGLLRNIFGEEA